MSTSKRNPKENPAGAVLKRGPDPKRASRAHHSPEVVAAVMGACLAGQGVNEVAKQFDIDKTQVSRWKSKLPKKFLDKIAENSADKFGKLLADALEASLLAMKAVTEQAQDKKWLSEQGASDLGVFYGIMCDKTVRMLEAAESARVIDAEAV